MSEISPSVLRSLGVLVPEQINYVCLVEFENKQWYLAMGRSTFYFIDRDLDKYKDPSIPYNKIQAIRLCSRNKNLM